MGDSGPVVTVTLLSDLSFPDGMCTMIFTWSGYHEILASSDVRARLGSARPDEGLGESKPEPQALKSLSRPKPWA
jgi:hypothetical protein